MFNSRARNSDAVLTINDLGSSAYGLIPQFLYRFLHLEFADETRLKWHTSRIRMELRWNKRMEFGLLHKHGTAQATKRQEMWLYILCVNDFGRKNE